jgi:VIT1/CCC1 family predicted Fe2+/Mn2+ transporter
MEPLDTQTREIILTAQKNEITEYHIYKRLSEAVKDPHNKKVLQQISHDELTHYNFWKDYTLQDVNPDTLRIWKYYLISRVLGLTFGIKLMEKGEEKAQETYEKISESVPAARTIIKDEDQHEKELIALIDEERLKYIGSIVLGLNDALVELTGALAGFTLALQNTALIAMTGLITGIAASLSMATSEYLSTKTEESTRDPVKAAVYTGTAYVITVFILIAPFLLLDNYYLCLGITILGALTIILVFTYYISIAKDISFSKRFVEMAVISLGIAGLTFIIGYLVKIALGVDV